MASTTSLFGESVTDPNLEAIKPPGKMQNDELVRFVRRRAYLSSPIYADDFSQARKAELYDQSDQWIQRARSAKDSVHPSQWRRVSQTSVDGNSIPLPVYNEGVLLRENESARLGRPEYKPRVRPSGSNPGINEKDGAKGAERALQFRLKEMWGDEEDKLFLHMPLYGGAWLKSYWDQTWMDTVRVPAPSLCCPRHPKSGIPLEKQGPPPLAGVDLSGIGGESGEIESPQEDALEGGIEEEGMNPMGMPPGMPSAIPCSYCRKQEAEGEPANQDQNRCPQCPDSPTLVPYSPTLDEALNSDLGQDVPKGDWFLGVPFPYQVFPVDAGVAVDPTDVPEWCEVYTKPIAWAEERWPKKVRDQKTGLLRVHPQNPATLMADNPTLGSPDVLQYAQHAGVFRSHVIVYEYHRKPWLEWDDESKSYRKNRGRSVVVVTGRGGDGVVCLDDHLLMESLNKPGTFVPRVYLQFIPWEKRDGGRRTTVGQSLWSRLFDPQDGINERAAQTRAVNQRGALPWYLQKAGINMETRSADSAVPFRRVIADIDPNDRQAPLTLLNNEVINPGVYQEIEFNSNHMSKHVVEVERGQVPPGVAAATAIAYLKTESGEKRRPRILRIRRGLTRAWEHGTQLMSALYIEDRPYTYEDDENSEEREAFINGEVIAKSNPRVDIYPTPDYDITDARRESIRDQVQLGILNPAQTPQLARKISTAMDESLEFFLDDDLQEQQAQREWRSFQDEGQVPVVDPTLDDDMTHYQEHGRACFSEWFREKESEAEWDKVLDILGSDWDEALKKVVMIAAMPTPQPGQVMMPTAPGMPPQLSPVIGGGIGAPAPGMPGAPPIPPPPPIPPRPSLQTMITMVWEKKLLNANFPANESLLEVVIPWRAHMEAHKLKVEVTQMKERMQAMAAVPAPGTGSAPTSTQEATVQEGAPQAPQPPQAPQQ